MARQVLTPLDLERTYGLTEGNIFHGDLSLEQLFFMRPVPGWARYRTPVEGLYLCGAGAHPGGGVTGAPGHNAARQVLRDWGEEVQRPSEDRVSRELPSSADVVILGAGVMGASIAFHLARRKAGRILVLDKGDVAHGGSGRSSALVRMHYSYPPEVDLAVKSLEIFRTWPEYVGRRGDFRQTGFVRIVPEKELPRLEKNVEMQRAHGVDARVVDRRELAEIVPDWNVDDVPYAAWEPGSGYGDGTGVADDFLERAREMGVELPIGNPRRGLLPARTAA